MKCENVSETGTVREKGESKNFHGFPPSSWVDEHRESRALMFAILTHGANKICIRNHCAHDVWALDYKTDFRETLILGGIWNRLQPGQAHS